MKQPLCAELLSSVPLTQPMLKINNKKKILRSHISYESGPLFWYVGPVGVGMEAQVATLLAITSAEIALKANQ